MAQRDVQGTAAKGLIKGARVNVYEIDAAGVRAGAALATATTGADGSYKTQVAASVRNFVIEVSAAPGAVMADEASGTDIAMPEGMKLRSIVTLAENATGPYQGTVSPLTEMVARTAETADGKLSQAAVAQAKGRVRTLLGFDPETVKPVNSNSAAAATASEDEKNQSLVLAAFSKMASVASPDCGQSNAGERIACLVGKVATSVIIKDGQPGLEPARLAQFRDAIEAVAQDKIINRTGKDKVVGLPVLTAPVAPAPVNPTPPEPTQPGPPPTPTPPGPVAGAPGQIEATKALFGSLRTNLRALGEGEAFQATAAAIKADLNGAVAPLANDVAGLATLAGSAVDLLDRIRAGSFTLTEVEVVGNQVRDTAPSFLRLANGTGRCEIVMSPLSIFCSVVQNPYLPGSAGDNISGTWVFTTRGFKLTPQAGSDTAYSYVAVLDKYTIQFSGWNVVGSSTRETIGNAYSGEITLARSGRTVTQLVMRGRMPGRLNAAGTLDSDYEDWALDLNRMPDADGLSLTRFSGQFGAMRAGQPAGFVAISDESYLRLALPDASGKVAANAANELQVAMRGIVGATTVDGTLRAMDGKLDKSKTLHLPTRLSFEGSLRHQDATVFSGQVALTRNGFENYDASAAVSPTNFIADSLDIGGVLSVSNRPALSLTVGATRTGPDATDISAQYRDGTTVVNASVTARAGEPHPLVKVSSADGVAFSFTGKAAAVPVTKDGAVTAQLNMGTGIITYADGSTESLK